LSLDALKATNTRYGSNSERVFFNLKSFLVGLNVHGTKTLSRHLLNVQRVA